ncbi:RNB domain-containing ribonuclease [Psychromicrobium xiongbiense]|uniref:RNB domain-containing ribonuclease n=1 Tax=Psychromicrobium xiongbiense TaxID=3051184 RepID=UPI002556E764|nr:RNB domain-containing ribonuclease [Psychromicrobium sp. YIM S02556]
MPKSPFSPWSPSFAETDASRLQAALAALRTEFALPVDFPADALAELERSIAGYQLPERDLRSAYFVTIDPPTSLDLDQAMCLERLPESEVTLPEGPGAGYLVRYAIADVPAFVPPGGALDAQTRTRGQSMYLPDGRIPLHPAMLSEDAASLLPQQERGGYIWEFRLDARAEVRSVTVYRATLISRAKLGYHQAQAELDAAQPSDYLPTLELLREIGQKRIVLERERGGASLNAPQQEIEHDDGGYRLVFRPAEPLEDWNAQLSLMTGMAAASMMLEAGVGILRTMPPPDPSAIARFRHQAEALQAPWPADQPYGEFLRTLDSRQPRHLALLHAATSLFRGAGYTAFDGEPPAQRQQAAVAAPYSHTTAPLRRLVDRFVLAVCAAHCAGEAIPGWARTALPQLPALMAASDQLAGRVDRAAVDLIEAAVLSDQVGQVFEAVIIARKEPNGSGVVRCTVQLLDPAVTAPLDVPLDPADPEASPEPGPHTGPQAGDPVRVRLLSADIARRSVTFALAEAT